MSRGLRSAVFTCLGLGLLSCGRLSSLVAAPPALPAPPASDADAAPGLPERLTPLRPRSGAEQERIEALALFAAGRALEDQEDYVGALRLYQRALRFDPESVAVLEQIVPLALSLNRTREAARYALTAIEIAPGNEPLLRRLAGVLSEEGDRAGALKLYERSAALLEKDARRKGLLILVRLEIGRLSYLESRYQEAADAFAAALPELDKPDGSGPEGSGLDEETRKGLFKNPSALYELIGEIYLKSDRPDDAEAAFRRAAAEDEKRAPSDDEDQPKETAATRAAKLLFRSAQVKVLRKEYDAALAELQKYFTSDAGMFDQEALELLAELLEKLNRSDELFASIEKAHAARPESESRVRALAEALVKASRPDDAIEHLERLVEEGPEASDLRQLAAIRRNKRDAEGLLVVLRGLSAAGLEMDELDEEGKAILADKELVDAILSAATERGTALDFHAARAAGDLALAVKRFEQARGYFDQALLAESEKSDKARLLLSWGLKLMGAERYPAAAAVFARASAERVLPRENPLFDYYQATVLELGGKTDEALRVIDFALGPMPDAPRLVTRRAWILYHAKRYAEAEQAYHLVLERFGEKQANREAVEAVRDARLILSHLCVLGKRIKEGEEWLELVLDENPEDVSASNDLGYLWADQGKHLDRALEMATRAVAAEPDNRAYLDTLGWVYFRLGRFAEAVQTLEKALDSEKPEAEVLDHLGDAYLAAGEKEKAIDAWRRALPIFDKATDGDKMKAAREKLEKQGVKVEP